MQQLVASFIYTDEDGKAVARIDRMEPGRDGRAKDFLPFLAFGAGFAQKPGLSGIALPLYHLPDVLRIARNGGAAFIVEGEGVADVLATALQRTQWVAVTTIAGGANAIIRAEHISALDGARKIVLMGDSDAPGRHAATTRAQAIADAHPLTAVYVLDLFHDRDDGSDAVQWLETHEPRELFDLVKAAPIIKPRAVSTPVVPQWEDLAPWPTLHEAALDGLAGDVVRAIAPQTEADPAALLFTFLTAFGNMIGPGPYLNVGAVHHAARLFTVVVGASAKARKGQSFAEVMAVFQEADAEAVEATRVSGLSTGEGLIARLHDREDGLPVEKRVFIHEPEFVRVLAVAGRDGATLSAILRDAWDGSTLRVMTRKEPLEAKGGFIAFLAHITQEELSSKLTNIETANGFANRMLFIAAKRSKLLPNGGSLSPNVRTELGERVRTALARARMIGEVRRSPEFSEAWEAFYRRAFPDEPGLFGALIARGDTQTLRLALIYCLLDGAHELRLEHLIAGYAAWLYVEDSERHIFGRKLGDDTQQRLLDELRAVYPGGLDRTEQNNLFGRHASEARLKDAREKLLARNLVAEHDEPTSGRSRSVLSAVPCEKREKSEISPLLTPLSSLLSLFSQVKNDTEIIE